MTVNVDTYVLPEDSNAYLSEVLPASNPLRVTWEVLTDEEKKGYLAAALVRLENIHYKGDRVYRWQPLKFPRISRGIPVNFNDAPIEVKRAQVVMAAEIVRKELYLKRRNSEACMALGILNETEIENTKELPLRVEELLHKWLTSWRRI